MVCYPSSFPNQEGWLHRLLTLHLVTKIASGRSFAIMPEGYVDLKEDFHDGYAGLEVTKALQRRYDAGDQMYRAD